MAGSDFPDDGLFGGEKRREFGSQRGAALVDAGEEFRSEAHEPVVRESAAWRNSEASHFLRPGQPHEDREPLPLQTLRPDPTLVQLHDVLDDAQPEAGAARLTGATFFHPIKAFEDVREIVRGDARAVVADKTFNFGRAVGAGTEDNTGTLRRVFKRILEQITEHLRDFFQVGTDCAEVGGSGYLDRVAGSAFTVTIVVGKLFKVVGEDDGFEFQPGRGRFEAGERKQIVNNGLQAIAMALDRLEKLLSLRLAHRRVAVDERLDVTLDNAERSAEFVGGVGHKITADALEFPLVGQVMDDEERPRGLPVGRRNRRARRLDPNGIGAIRNLEFLARQRLPGPGRADVFEKSGTADDEFEAEVNQVARRRENLPQGAIREVNVVGLVDDQHGFT